MRVTGLTASEYGIQFLLCFHTYCPHKCVSFTCPCSLGPGPHSVPCRFVRFQESMSFVGTAVICLREAFISIKYTYGCAGT